MKKLKVLLIAESCNPEWTSGPLIGWSFYKALVKIADVHLVTQIRNKNAVINKGLKEEKDVTFIDSEIIAKYLYKMASFLRGGSGKGWTTMTAFSSLSYYYFEYLVWKKFKDKLRAKKFDIVHRITPITPTAQSLITKKCKKIQVPFVIGPLNGGLPWPKEFNNRRLKEKEWFSYIPRIYKLLPYYKSTRKYASAIVIASKATYDQLPKKYHHKCVYVPENAIDSLRFKLKRTKEISKPIKVVFIGRLVPYKGVDMLIEAAVPLIKKGLIELEIYGDGPETPELKKLVEKEKIQQNVNLAGWIEHTELQKKIILADIFAFPSIREFGGAVCLEAMASGLVPIVVDYGGPGELVTEKTGYLIKIGSKDQIVKQFREVLTKIIKNPEEINLKRKEAIKRAKTLFTWDVKAKQVLEVYKWVLGKRKDKPYWNFKK